MSRNMIAIAVALALLTGIVIGHLTAVDSPGQEPRVLPSDHRLEGVRSFYDGMNAYLETGNSDFLHVLAPDFEDMGSLNAEPSPAETLVTRLDALRASSAVPEFQIEEIHDLGQVIQVRLSTGLPDRLEAGGFAIAGYASGPTIEFLQVQGDAIVARWGQDDRIPVIDVSLSNDFPRGVATLLNVETALVTLEPGVEWQPASTDPALLVVERGSVSLGTGSGVERISERASRALPSGDVRIANRAEGASSVWIVSVGTSPASQTLIPGESDAVPAGVTIETTVSSLFWELPAALDSIVVDLARATVPPGTTLTPSDQAFGHHVIVLGGSVDAEIYDGELLQVTESGLSTTVRDRVSIPSGNATASLPGASTTYRVNGSGSAELLILTIDTIANGSAIPAKHP